MSKKIEQPQIKEYTPTDNVIPFSSLLSRLQPEPYPSHTVNSDELRQSITNLLDQRKKRVNPSNQSLESLPYTLLSSLSDEELKLLTEFFESFENNK